MKPESSDRPTFVILGAAGGVGRDIASRLLSDGARVVCTGRSDDPPACLGPSTAATWRRVDAARPDEVERAAAQAKEAHGRLDGLVNCAGSLLLKPAHLTTSEEWNGVVEANLGTAFATVRAAGKVMTAGGSVVLFASAAARVGLANHEAIAAAKAGVVGLTLSAAATYASRNLRFNAIAPGLVKTGMARRITSNETALAASTDMHPLGRIGEPGEIARWAAWLLEPENSWVTGQVFAVDGGLSTVRATPARRRTRR